MSKSQITHATEICLCIQEGGGVMNTTNLLAKMDMSRTMRAVTLKLLHKLAKAGTLTKHGVGKYRWELASDWNRSNPFHSPASKTSSTNDGDDMATATSSTGKKISRFHNPSCKRCGQAIEEGTSITRWTKPTTLVNYWVHENCTESGEKIPEKPVQKLAQNNVSDAAIAALVSRVAELSKQVAELESTRKVEITLKQPDKAAVKISKRVHPLFEQVMFHINCGDNVMLVGPKGCGKTTLAQDVADAMDRDFGLLSLSGGVTEGKLFGRSVPNITSGKNEFHSTQFTDLWENGGIFLLDEIDAGDPNVLLACNSALANNHLSLDRSKNRTPDRHKDNVVLAAANTWGNGADRKYVGRNQQDSAFIERFVQLAMDYDSDLEIALCPGARELVDLMHTYRARIVANKMERELSTRFICRAYNWLQHGKDLEYVKTMFFAGWRTDEINKVKGGY